jgi:predicted nucleic-acid-binding Zn-ribbon protein
MSEEEYASFEHKVPSYGDKGQVVGYLSMKFDGTIRKCEPLNLKSICPSCGAKKSPLIIAGRLRLGARTHPVVIQDEEFVQRHCRKCGMVWREFNTTGRSK